MARPKGSKNKVGAEVKAQIMACYERIGGLKRFTEWAGDHPGEFFRMYAQLAPKELSAEIHVTDESTLTDGQLADIAAGRSAGAIEQAISQEEPGGVH